MAHTATDHHDSRHEHHDAANPVPSLLSRVSWGAIFAGATIALGIIILLGLMGTAMGFGAIEPGSGNPFDGLGIGTAIWWVITSVLALAIGGFAAGQAAGQTDRSSAMAHGAATWGLVTIVTLWMATSAIGSAVSTASSAVSTVASASAQVVGTVGGAVLPDDIDLSPQLREARERIRAEAEQVLAQSDIGEQELEQAQDEVSSTAENIARNPGQLDSEVSQLVDRLFDGEDAVFTPAERQRLIEALSARAGTSPEEAEQIASRWEQQAQSAASSIETAASDIRTTATETSDTALDALSSVAWYAFFASLLSMIAAISAAAFAAPSHPYVSERRS